MNAMDNLKTSFRFQAEEMIFFVACTTVLGFHYPIGFADLPLRVRLEAYSLSLLAASIWDTK